MLSERGYIDLICLTEVKQALFSVQEDLALQMLSEPLNPPLCVVFELSFDKFDVRYLCQKVVIARAKLFQADDAQVLILSAPCPQGSFVYLLVLPLGKSVKNHLNEIREPNQHYVLANRHHRYLLRPVLETLNHLGLLVPTYLQDVVITYHAVLLDLKGPQAGIHLDIGLKLGALCDSVYAAIVMRGETHIMSV